MTNYDLVNQDNKICPHCAGSGYVGDQGAGRKGNSEYEPCICKSVADTERKIYELSVKEFKELMVECFEMLKQRELDTAMEEYKKLTLKPITENLNDGRKIVPQEY